MADRDSAGINYDIAGALKAVGSFAKGVAKGLAHFATDAVMGTAELATLPLRVKGDSESESAGDSGFDKGYQAADEVFNGSDDPFEKAGHAVGYVAPLAVGAVQGAKAVGKKMIKGKVKPTVSPSVESASSTPVGRRGAPLEVSSGTNTSSIIGGRKFTGHALDKMQSRGFTPSVIENTIANGVKSAGNRPNTFQHILDKVKVITNANGDVITVIPQ